MASSLNPPGAANGFDLRERTFQNVIDTILRPSGIKVGGFPEDMFIDLDDDDKERFTCNICYLIINECRQCDNSHSFCRSCIVAWSLTYGENAQKCPFCRCRQTDYQPNKNVDKMIGDKRVKCTEDGCSFRAPLKIYLMHSHGKAAFSNADVDFDKLRPAPSPVLLISPFALSSQGGRATGIREQLLQGRMMIQQMMLLMHLEMQLRQQALVSYEETSEPAARLQRLDDVMALNEQLNEVGSILSMLLNAPINRPVASQEARLRLTGDTPLGFEDLDQLSHTNQESRLRYAGGTPRFDLEHLASPAESSSDSSRSSSPAGSVGLRSESFSVTGNRPLLRGEYSVSGNAAGSFHPEAVRSIPARIASLSNPRDNQSSSLQLGFESRSDAVDTDAFANRYSSSKMLGFSGDRGGNSRSASVMDSGLLRSRFTVIDIVPPLELESASHDRTGMVDRGTTLSGRDRAVRSVVERRSHLLNRGQEFGLRLASPETGESTSFHSQGTSTSVLSGLDETSSVSRQSHTNLPRINTTSSLTASPEANEDGVSASDGRSAYSSMSTPGQPFVDQLPSRNEQALLELQQRSSSASDSLNESQQNPSVILGTVTASRAAVPSVVGNHSTERNKVSVEEAGVDSGQAVSSPSRLRGQGQGLHQERRLKQTSRPRFMSRNASQEFENPTGIASHSLQTKARSVPKPNSVRTPGISRTPSQFLNRTSLPNANTRPMMLGGVANYSSSVPRRSLQSPPNTATKVVSVPRPPGTSSLRRPNDQAPPDLGAGRGSLMRSRRRSEIQQELLKSRRHDD